MTGQAFKERTGDLKSRVETVMNDFMRQQVQPGSRLSEAVDYALKTGGKRIRPLLCYATAELLDVPLSVADFPAAAIELIHTYSLVHDDLPAMDDDDLRRGQPTTHKAYDEATAILVGDALLTHAFGLLATAPVDPDLGLQWVRQLSSASGAAGMIQGQSTDMEGEGRLLDLRELETMHRKKSGRLIEASLTMVARAAGNAEKEAMLAAFGHHIGLAFQIRDDILDVEATTETLGKPQGSDLVRNKSTFVSLLGVDAARARMQAELLSARDQLNELGDGNDALGWLAEYIVAREF